MKLLQCIVDRFYECLHELDYKQNHKTIKQMSVALHSASDEGKNYGISIVVHLSSEVPMGGRDEHLPAHAVIYDGCPYEENRIGEIVLTDEITKDKSNMWSSKHLDDIEEIIEVPRSKKGKDVTKYLPHKIKKKIYEWANSVDDESKLHNWHFLINTWNRTNPHYKIKIHGRDDA